MPATTFAEVRRWRAEVAAQSGERDRAAASVVAGAAELKAIDAQITDAQGRGAVTAALEKKRGRAAETHRSNSESLGRLDDALRDVLGRLQLDPGDADPGYPLVLLPVRLETRYTVDGSALRVRIYPDDIHVDALDRGITPDERLAGVAYWNAVWRASEEQVAEGWRTLLAATGSLRASWIARALRPVNCAQRAEALRSSRTYRRARSDRPWRD